MELAMEAGHVLLESGAEIFRVEETMDRICRHYGVQSGNAFVLSNGIFATTGSERERYYAKGAAHPGERDAPGPGGGGEPAVAGDRGGALQPGGGEARPGRISSICPGSAAAPRCWPPARQRAFCYLFGGGRCGHGLCAVCGADSVPVRAVCQRAPPVEDCGEYLRRSPGDVNLQRCFCWASGVT